ncbi:hypothetical protein DFH06DRAFT_1296009 [Mycena polygramma]|nr:hypothetical protein DFH06DRAFT_1296009 [Mycena polygramma]
MSKEQKGPRRVCIGTPKDPSRKLFPWVVKIQDASCDLFEIDWGPRRGPAGVFVSSISGQKFNYLMGTEELETYPNGYDLAVTSSVDRQRQVLFTSRECRRCRCPRPFEIEDVYTLVTPGVPEERDAVLSKRIRMIYEPNGIGRLTRGTSAPRAISTVTPLCEFRSYALKELPVLNDGSGGEGGQRERRGAAALAAGEIASGRSQMSLGGNVWERGGEGDEFREAAALPKALMPFSQHRLARGRGDDVAGDESGHLSGSKSLTTDTQESGM